MAEEKAEPAGEQNNAKRVIRVDLDRKLTISGWRKEDPDGGHEEQR